LKITGDISQLRIPMRNNPLGCTFSYLLVNDATLVDLGVGTKDAESALKSQLGENGLRVSDIEKVIITHLHNDHIGLLHYIKSSSKASIYVHEKALDILNQRSGMAVRGQSGVKEETRLLGGGELLKLMGTVEEVLRPNPDFAEIDETLHDGEAMKLREKTLGVIWTPGHAKEEICLYDSDEQVLFSGDHVLPEITPHISLHAFEKGNPLLDYLSSLDKVKALKVKLVLPAHEHIFYNLEERVEQIKRHHRERCNEIENELIKGERTVYQISAHIPWNSRPWNQMPFWTKRMAAAETLTHLAYLEEKREVTERTVDGVMYFSLAKQ
jgi:glyoxylase-like metal-dependent hydrolase (beta-lactamase superfamily II)